MSYLLKFTKLTVLYFSLLPLSYLVIYEVFFSQNMIIIDQLIKIYDSWRTDFIQDIVILDSSLYECPQYYENVLEKSTKFLSTKQISLQSNLLCIKRISESNIFQYSIPIRQYKVCFRHERTCNYKNINLCISYSDQCPISDIKFSNENSLEGFEKIDEQFNNLNVFIKREDQGLKPLIKINITNENVQDSKYDKYYYDKNLGQNDKVLQNDSDLQQLELQLKSDQIEKIEQIDSDQQNQLFIIKEEVIDIQNKCILLTSDLFQLNFVKAGYLILISVFVQVYKTCIIGMHIQNEELSPFYKHDTYMMIMCLLSDIFYIYSTFYTRIEYYNLLDSFLSKGCFDAYGEIYNMKQQIDMKIEIVGIFLSSITLLVAFIIGSLVYLTFFTITIISKHLKSKLFTQSQPHKQSTLDQIPSI
ncbi:hypothetical protein ABPG74_006090 [Tetrahymena malaccensis]